MIILDAYQGKTVAVFGLGKAGRATVHALLAGGAKVIAWDDSETSREALKQEAKEPLEFSKPKHWVWEEISLVCLSPGVPLTHPRPHEVVTLARSHHTPIIGDIELLYQACPYATYVAITGTNGKSTTTALIGHILKSAGKKVEVGGNIGVPALALENCSQGEIFVLELSSYQLDLTATTRFDVGVLLNLSPDHLDRHGSMEGYLHAKMRIFDRQGKSDTAVIAVDDLYTQAIAVELSAESEARLVAVSANSENPNIVHMVGSVLTDPTATPAISYDMKDIRSLKGWHNGQNAVAAYAACRAVGLAPEQIFAGMKTFPGLAHRMEWVVEMEGVTFINDSKATNADAASHALKAFDNIYWIAGGKAKAGGIESLKPLFPRIKRAYLIGEASGEFDRTLGGHVASTECGTLEKAVQKAFADAVHEGIAHPVVLLSPACASFDQFANFEERGEVFKQLVHKLEKAAA